jgi:mRNA interferase MazF
MVNIIRGDVILCDLNPVIGSEQSGIRPVVILQSDRANRVSPHTIIAPFTTKIRQALPPSHVLVPQGIGGLSQDSVILCEQIRVIDRSRVIKFIGHLEEQYIQQLAKALKIILDL